MLSQARCALGRDVVGGGSEPARAHHDLIAGGEAAERCFDALAKRKLPEIARALAMDIVDVQEAIARIALGPERSPTTGMTRPLRSRARTTWNRFSVTR